MDESEVKKIVRENIEPIKVMLGLSVWKITDKYEHADGNYGEVSVLGPYKKCDLVIDPKQHKTKAEVLDTLRHELIHTMLAPYDTYRDQVKELLSDAEHKALSVCYSDAEERIVKHFEDLFDVQLKINVNKLVALGKKLNAR